MGNPWRYPLEDNQTQQEILAEIVAHAISRIELLNGKNSQCMIEEYREWLFGDPDNYVMVINKIQENLE